MKNKENTTEEILINEDVKETSKDFSLEAAIIARSEDLNIPALASFFEVNEDVVRAALAKK
jgi:hypothetical protein